ncbi:MAG: hypothetical protein QNJ14_10470 [Woeseiaceae bacterium]|nr:hypothetical protein [Woeseiaceae bacterium]
MQKALPIVLLVLLAALAFSSCTSRYKEYDASDASRDFQIDIEKGRLTAFSVCGYSCETPGFPMLTHMYCYGNSVSVQTIGPVGDMSHFDGHFRLQRKAGEYAEAYDSLLYEHVQEAQLGTCPDGEDWDSALFELHRQFQSEDDFRTTVGAPLSLDDRFFIVYGDNADQDSLPGRTCQIFLDSGIERSVSVEASKAGQDDESGLVFECIAGEVGAVLMRD